MTRCTSGFSFSSATLKISCGSSCLEKKFADLFFSIFSKQTVFFAIPLRLNNILAHPIQFYFEMKLFASIYNSLHSLTRCHPHRGVRESEVLLFPHPLPSTSSARNRLYSRFMSRSLNWAMPGGCYSGL
jgi:hypothetical protein